MGSNYNERLATYKGTDQVNKYIRNNGGRFLTLVENRKKQREKIRMSVNVNSWNSVNTHRHVDKFRYKSFMYTYADTHVHSYIRIHYNIPELNSFLTLLYFQLYIYLFLCAAQGRSTFFAPIVNFPNTVYWIIYLSSLIWNTSITIYYADCKHLRKATLITSLVTEHCWHISVSSALTCLASRAYFQPSIQKHLKCHTSWSQLILFVFLNSRHQKTTSASAYSLVPQQWLNCLWPAFYSQYSVPSLFLEFLFRKS